MVQRVWILVCCVWADYKRMQAYHLGEKFTVYKKAFEMLVATRELFKKLFVEFKICIKCIFRLYGFEQPKIYNDSEFYLEAIPILLQLDFDHPSLKSYDPGQCCLERCCWLCLQIFQKSYINNTVKQILTQIDQKSFNSHAQFKLNIRVPNVLILRNIILARYLYYQLQHTTEGKQINANEEQTKGELVHYYNILVFPFEANKFIDPKTILKWILANELNLNSEMTSSADDHPDNLVISIDQDHTNTQAETTIMNQFRTYLGLEKNKEKAKGRKRCVDLGQNQPTLKEYKCNANNINKILNLKQTEFEQLFANLHTVQDFWKLVSGGEEPLFCSVPSISHKISLLTKNVFICGRYIKFSRYLSQTPWIVNGKKLTEGSLQQEIQDLIYSLLYPGKAKHQIETRFHSGGREDIDVRMLKGGRPFVLEFVNPIKTIKHISENQVLQLVTGDVRERVQLKFKEWLSEQKQPNQQQFHSWRIVKLMELVVNQQSKSVKVQDLQQTTQSFISVELKAAEMQKIKHYLCYIHSPTAFTQNDKQLLQQHKDLVLQQLTPLRVLHRRTLMIRQKTIHRLKMHLVSKHSAILQVWASAGTYIKEFVHGDLGRTTPNVGSMLGKEVDILQLDVGSLKEGEWRSGDEQSMKMERFQWMD